MGLGSCFCRMQEVESHRQGICTLGMLMMMVVMVVMMVMAISDSA